VYHFNGLEKTFFFWGKFRKNYYKWGSNHQECQPKVTYIVGSRNLPNVTYIGH